MQFFSLKWLQLSMIIIGSILLLILKSLNPLIKYIVPENLINSRSLYTYSVNW